MKNIFKPGASLVKGTIGESGTGLGLILCKEFVELNNGNIWIKSKANVGTTIEYTIPLYKKAALN